MGTLRKLRLIVAMLLMPGLAFGDDASGAGTQALIDAWDNLESTVDGDTYYIDAGTQTWTVSGRISIGKGVNIIGAGIDKTIIEYDLDSIPGNQQLISFFSANGFRFANLTIKDDVGNSVSVGNGGAVLVDGDAAGSIDNIKFTSTAGSGYRAIYISGGDTGAGQVVVWGCDFQNRGFVTYPRNGAGNYGDYTWGTAIPWGTVNMPVFEDNTMARSCSFDGDNGAMYTVRFNQFTDSYVHGHGPTSGRQRGSRWCEVYENDFEWVEVSNRAAMVERRSGSGIVFNNDIIPHPSTGEPDNFVQVSNYRLAWRIAPWYFADGKNKWDLAYTDDGVGTPGGAGDGVYESGTITSVEGDKDFTDSSKSGVWTNDEWIGYTLRVLGPQAIEAAAGSTGNSIVVSPDPGWTNGMWTGYAIRDLSTGRHTRVSGNTSDTITTDTSTTDNLPNFSVSPGDTFDVFLSNILVDSTSGGAMTTSDIGPTNEGNNGWPDITGRSYELRKIRQLIDGIARGTANTTNLGTTPAPVPPAGFTQTAAALPWYEWGNTSTGSLGARITRGTFAAFSITSDIEYFDYEASFDGTVGVGVGTKAEMNAITPTTDNVGFWVTDEANWDTTTPGTDGQLYQWNGSAWVLYYTPLEYPHPRRATLAELPGASGAAYSGRLRFNGTGAKPIRTDGTGQPIIFDQ